MSANTVVGASKMLPLSLFAVPSSAEPGPVTRAVYVHCAELRAPRSALSSSIDERGCLEEE